MNIVIFNNNHSLFFLDKSEIKKVVYEEFKNTLFLISAGNDSHNLNEIPVYPQCSKLENGIVIGSIKKTGERQLFSNYDNMVNVYDIGEKTSESMARYCGKVIDYWNQYPDKNNIQIKNELLNKSIYLFYKRGNIRKIKPVQ